MIHENHHFFKNIVDFKILVLFDVLIVGPTRAEEVLLRHLQGWAWVTGRRPRSRLPALWLDVNGQFIGTYYWLLYFLRTWDVKFTKLLIM